MIGDRKRSRLERTDVAEAEIGQRHAFARGTEQGAVLGDAKRAKAKRIAHDHQLAVGRDQDDVVGPVEPFGDPAEHADPIGLLILGLQLVGQRVHDDFGVGVPLQVIVALGEQLVLEFLVVGELAVEGKRKPLRLAAVVSLEWLSIRSVVAAASRIAHVADRGRAVDPSHDRIEFLAMIEPKRFGDRAHFFVGIDQRLRSGLKLVMPAASWPRFCMSSNIRGTSRATLLMSPAIGASDETEDPRHGRRRPRRIRGEAHP